MSEASRENVLAACEYLDAHPEDDGTLWQEGARVFELLRGGKPRELHGDEAYEAQMLMRNG